MSQERLIGAGSLELTVGELSWERVDREVVSGFMSHLKCIDPLLLGLEDDVVSAYLLGTTRRHVGARQIGTEGPLDILSDISRPEILIDLRALSLSNLSYQLLIPHTSCTWRFCFDRDASWFWGPRGPGSRISWRVSDSTSVSCPPPESFSPATSCSPAENLNAGYNANSENNNKARISQGNRIDITYNKVST